MTTNQNKLLILARAAKKNQLVRFTYKKENGEKSERILRIAVDVARRMDKQNKPISGVGNWHKGMSFGQRGTFIKGGGEYYVRGVDMESKGAGLKIFKLGGISNLRPE